MTQQQDGRLALWKGCQWVLGDVSKTLNAGVTDDSFSLNY